MENQNIVLPVATEPPIQTQPTVTSAAQSPSQLPPIGQLFSESWALMKKRIGVMFLSSLTLVVGALAAGVIIALLGLLGYMLVDHTVGMIVWGAGGLVWTVGYLYLLGWAGATQLVALRDAEENTGVRENIKRSRQFVGSFLLITIIMQLAVMGGFLLFIVPGIILGTRYGFALVVLIMEGKKGRSAIAQSKAYVMGRTGAVFLRYFLVGLMFVGAAIVLQLLMYFNKGSGIAIICQILNLIAQIVFTYFILTMGFVLYGQLKNTAGSVDGAKYVGGVTGWTIWGVVGWIAYFGLIFGLVFMGLNSARNQFRDAKRLADVRQIDSALELYYKDKGEYPVSLQTLSPKYILQLPEAPTPPDGNCFDSQNTYVYQSLNSGQDFALTFCLGKDLGGYSSGPHTANYKDGIK